MAIRLSRAALGAALERAYALARSDSQLPRDWLARVERIESAPAKTYIAALGAALLAKATDARVDSLAHNPAASERGYSLRSVAEFLASKRRDMGFDIGSPSRWPLNNAPFNRNHERIDRFHSISPASRPFYEDFVRYLRELDQLNEDEAGAALAVFLRRRIAAAAANQADADVAAPPTSTPDALELAKLFVTEAPEGGRRGQALTAAVFDLVYPNVHLRPINDPRRIDVSAGFDEPTFVGAEVKQAPVDEDVALALAGDAAAEGIERAILVAINLNQRPLDIGRLRYVALQDSGVLLEVCTSVEGLVSLVVFGSSVPVDAVGTRLADRLLSRMAEHGLSAATRERWLTLCRDLPTTSSDGERARLFEL